MHSTARVGRQRVSTILSQLPAGTAVTTPRHHVQFVVTEHGVANLGMLTVGERGAALTAIAHPDFRAALRSV
jgi:acyl-CoA hydrolase